MTDDRMTMDARAQAVEAMAQAMLGAWQEAVGYAGDEDDLRDCRVNATAALDALLSSGLAVLMGSLEQVGALEKFIADDGEPALRATPGPLFRLRSREEECT